MMATNETGMRAFLIVWTGQLVSVIGTTVSGFALQFWVFLETGSVTELAIVAVAFTVPAAILSPFAGALVDRWDRRTVMIAADTLAGVSTMALAALYLTDSLQIWHLYVFAAVGAIGNTFQAPAWLAAMPTLVPKQHLGRAGGMTQMIEAVSFVLGPVLAGALLAVGGLPAVLIVDLATFGVAIAGLAIVRFPRVSTGRTADSPSLLEEVRLGWRFLRDRSGLMWLLWMYAGVNFVLAFTNVLIIPLVLTVAGEGTAGTVLSVGGMGLLAGSLAMSVWGGPKRRIASITMGIVASGLALAVAGLRPNVVVMAAGFVLLLTIVPVVNTSSQVLWQTKVPLDMQGRVFSLRRTVSQVASPLAMVATGPLADRLFEPMLAADGALAGTVGRVIGTGPGRGIGFLIILSGLFAAVIGLAGWLHPRVRNLETELPDMIPDDEPGAAAGAGADPSGDEAAAADVGEEMEDPLPVG